MRRSGFDPSRVAVIRCKLRLMTEEVDNRCWTISHAKVTPRYCSVTTVVPMLDNYPDDDRGPRRSDTCASRPEPDQKERRAHVVYFAARPVT